MFHPQSLRYFIFICANVLRHTHHKYSCNCVTTGQIPLEAKGISANYQIEEKSIKNMEVTQMAKIQKRVVTWITQTVISLQRITFYTVENSGLKAMLHKQWEYM